MTDIKTTSGKFTRLYNNRDVHNWEQLAARAQAAFSSPSLFILRHQQIYFGALVAHNHKAPWPYKAQTAAQQAHAYGGLLYAAWDYVSCYIPEMEFFIKPFQDRDSELAIRRQCEFLHELKFPVPSPEAVMDCLPEIIPSYEGMDTLPEAEDRLWRILLEGRYHRSAFEKSIQPSPTPSA